MAGSETVPQFDIPQSVLDAVDEVADVEVTSNWKTDPPDELLIAVAHLDETLKEAAEDHGVTYASMSHTMERLVYELHRRKDARRYSAARVAHEVMERGLQDAARRGAHNN